MGIDTNTLCLNRSYYPCNIISAGRAMTLAYEGAADIIHNGSQYDFDTWLKEFSINKDAHTDYDTIGLTDKKLKTPTVIRCKNYNKTFGKEVKFTRKNVLMRDQFICQYCKKKYKVTELSLDHVIPRAKGGTTCWENIVCCCKGCNNYKGSRLPKEIGLEHPKPRKPRWIEMLIISQGQVHVDWEPYLFV